MIYANNPPLPAKKPAFLTSYADSESEPSCFLSTWVRLCVYSMLRSRLVVESPVCSCVWGLSVMIYMHVCTDGYVYGCMCRCVCVCVVCMQARRYLDVVNRIPRFFSWFPQNWFYSLFLGNVCCLFTIPTDRKADRQSWTWMSDIARISDCSVSRLTP